MNSKNKREIKFAVLLLLIYILSAVLLYWIGDDQFHFRQSKGNISMQLAEHGSIELSEGSVIEQTFSAKIQRLKTVSVQWGTYYRQNYGNATMELINLIDGKVLMSRNIDVANIEEGDIIEMSSEYPIDSIYNVPLQLKIYADSKPGSSASPMMAENVQVDNNYSLSFNGKPVNGVICFSVTGEDYIWIGLHYWEFVIGIGIILFTFSVIFWIQYKQGKQNRITNLVIAMKKYRFLINQLVSRDFKTKYKRSILGVFWSFLNPLLTMGVQYIVFSNLFRFDLPNYQVYLIIGIVFFNFFSESTNMALGAIIGNAGLITKVYVPKYIYPLTRVISSLVNLLISLIPLLLVTFFSGINPTKAYLLIPFALCCITFFCLGIGLVLASAMVFFRDIQFLWGVLTMIWMYLTPIFYPASILPKNIIWILDFNPLYHFISFTRSCIMDGVSPEPIVYFECLIMSASSLLIGSIIFKKTQDRFILFL